ncbi:MAG: flagellar biosynthesis anti-sigma factor FlgM [Desulfobacteraceae bacterium]|nr:MAG: flagellar biosynthesis anti-sigma factor FlgM [Desulfobacteraceae bacterium]
MKINSSSTGIELLSYLKQIRQQQQKPNDSNAQPNARQAAEMDKVNVSDRAREVLQASRSLQGVADVREAKVAQVKLDVNNGTYKVVGSKVATEMLRESLENGLIMQSMSQS